jgi:hypothetical protein
MDDDIFLNFEMKPTFALANQDITVTSNEHETPPIKKFCFRKSWNSKHCYSPSQQDLTLIGEESTLLNSIKHLFIQISGENVYDVEYWMIQLVRTIYRIYARSFNNNSGCVPSNMDAILEPFRYIVDNIQTIEMIQWVRERDQIPSQVSKDTIAYAAWIWISPENRDKTQSFDGIGLEYVSQIFSTIIHIQYPHIIQQPLGNQDLETLSFLTF